MDLVDAVPVESMDEILFASVIEACVRIGQLDLLSEKLSAVGEGRLLDGLSAPTYGSMIKAYGRAKDLPRVRSLWEHMRSRHVAPTPITLGCMVDALVSNGQAEDAAALVEEMGREDGDLLNTVVFSTLLKGFALARKPDRVEDIFARMHAAGVVCNTVTYNTMIDAHVKSGGMDRAEQLFRSMEESGAAPDVITYSTMVKGCCMAGDIDKAFVVFREMGASCHEPDEILYNSLLDGCARQQRVDDALALLAEMQRNHVSPSNFTLSIIVKMLARARRLNQAFSLVEQTCASCCSCRILALQFM
jgi:pentatricopeptide repeat protein